MCCQYAISEGFCEETEGEVFAARPSKHTPEVKSWDGPAFV